MKVRFSVFIDEELKKWLEEESSRIGITQGGLINLALSKYKEDREVISTMRDLSTLVDKLENMKK